MELEEALTQIGAYGKYQVLLWWLMAGMDSWPASWHMLVMTFIGYEPKHHCSVPVSSQENASIPMIMEDGKMAAAKCLRFKNVSISNGTEGCIEGWWYDTEVMSSSVVTEWDLVCDKNFLAETSQSVYMAGLFVGGSLMGVLSDRWGRKKVMFAGFVAGSVGGVIASVSPNIYMFMAFRFIVGVFVVGENLTGFIMACELFPVKQRSIFGTLHELQWSIGLCILPGIAFALRHFGWRYTQLAISLPAVLALLAWRIVPESLPWLISKGRLTEAEHILETAAKFNGRTLPPRCLHGKQDEQIEETRTSAAFVTPLILIKTPQLRKITFCGSMFWFANVMVYYGLSQNAASLSGNLYVNFFLISVVEVLSLALAVLLLYKKGRRYPTGALYVFCGVACIVIPFIPKQTAAGTDLSWLTILLAMVGKFSINAAFTMSMVYIVELFPTVVRATGFMFTNIFGRLGGMLYPYILYLNKKDELGPIRTSLPYIIFGAMSIAAAGQVLWLPETRGRTLPETIEEVESKSAFAKVSKGNGPKQNIVTENEVWSTEKDNHGFQTTDL